MCHTNIKKLLVYLSFFTPSLFAQDVSGAAQTYNITTFAVRGASQTSPGAINNAGVVVGVYNVTAGGGRQTSYGFLRSPDGTFTTLNPPGYDGDTIYSFAITSQGGVYGNYTVAPQTYRSFSYKDGIYRLLSIGDGSTEVSAGNIHGAVTGYYSDFPNWFLFRPGQPLIQLEAPGQQQTVGSAINDKGILVGYYNNYYGEDVDTNGFELVGNRYLPVNVPSPAQDTTPTWINNNGAIVGVYIYENQYYHGFVFQNGTYQDFVVPGAVHTYIDGINDQGVLSGSYQDTDGNVIAYLAMPTQ